MNETQSMDLLATVQGSGVASCRIAVSRLNDSAEASLPKQRLLCSQLLMTIMQQQGLKNPAEGLVIHDDLGAPMLFNPDLGAISLSHDDVWCAVAFSAGSRHIGVDIQVPRLVSDLTLRRLAPDLRMSTRDYFLWEEFARRWASREAVSKALRTGLDSRMLRAPLPIARNGRDFGVEYQAVESLISPPMVIALVDGGQMS